MATLAQDPIAPTDRDPEWSPSERRRVIVRLSDGDVVQAGTAANLDGATALARSIVAELQSPTGEWPRVGDRLLHPAAVVSVDVLRIDP